jgi:hypothetical protein
MRSPASSVDAPPQPGPVTAETTPGPETRSQAVAALAAELAETYGGVSYEAARFVLDDELRRGRLAERNGQLVLVREAFAPDLLDALSSLGPLLDRERSASAGPRRYGRLGWGARRVEQLPRVAEPRRDRRPVLPRTSG